MLSVGDKRVSQVRRSHYMHKSKVRKHRSPKGVNLSKIVGFVHKITPRYCDIGLLVPVLGLVLFGVLMIYSASHYNFRFDWIRINVLY